MFFLSSLFFFIVWKGSCGRSICSILMVCLSFHPRQKVDDVVRSDKIYNVSTYGYHCRKPCIIPCYHPCQAILCGMTSNPVWYEIF